MDEKAQPGQYDAIIQRLQRQQRIYHAGLALVGVLLLSLGGAAFLFQPASAYLERDGFSLAVCYPPDREHILRPLSCDEAGRLALVFAPDGPQARQTIGVFTAQERSLQQVRRYVWGFDRRGVWPEIVGPGEELLAIGLPADPMNDTWHWPYYRVRLRPAASGGDPLPVPAEPHFMLVVPRNHKPGIAAQQGRALALTYYDKDAAAPERFLVRSKSGGEFSAGRKLPESFMRGSAWHAGNRSFAHVTQDGRLFVYDFASGWFVEDKARAKLGQRLRQAGVSDSYFYLTDSFAVFHRNDAYVLLPDDGPELVLHEITPYTNTPSGKPRGWLSQLPQMLEGLRYSLRYEDMTEDEKARYSERTSERNTRRQLAEAPRVLADLCSHYTFPALVDGDTVALVDLFYYRVTLVRIAPQGT